jgi:4-amino-4-deoxy-L-arabinose transferase-like glycosyltransferase
LACFVSLRDSKLSARRKTVNDPNFTTALHRQTREAESMTTALGSRWPSIAALAAGLALRLYFVLWFPAQSGDGPMYQALARNWLTHGIYGLDSGSGQILPTSYRLPGYPAFLAAVSFFFRRGDLPLLLAQVLMDLMTCLLVAALAGWLVSQESRKRVQLAALWLAALCPFLANYTAVALTEVLATFWTTAALVIFIGCLGGREMYVLRFGSRAIKINAWLAGGLAVGMGTLVRPETPLLLIALGIVLLWRVIQRRNWSNTFRVGALAAAGLVLPLIPWGVRNAATMHQFQFLAPRYAESATEVAPRGFYSWTNTWLVRFRDVYLTIWKLDTDTIPVSDIPNSAFDSPEERARVATLLYNYNKVCCEVTSDWDAQFAAIARERTARHPLRTYFIVPAERVFVLWFTPRIELLPYSGNLRPIKASFAEDPVDFSVTLLLCVIAVAYVVLAAMGITRSLRRRLFTNSQNYMIGLLVTFCIVRTLFFTHVETPEPRYVLECFPAVFALGALWWFRRAA